MTYRTSPTLQELMNSVYTAHSRAVLLMEMIILTRCILSAALYFGYYNLIDVFAVVQKAKV